jgi:DNA repair protein RadC
MDNGSIKDWAVNERPREKMMERGEQALTDAELLAILIGSGTQKKSAVQLMKEVMDACDNRLSLLSKMTLEELMAFNGIGEAKALTIKAAAEIGRRRALEKANDIDQITTAEDVYNMMHPLMRDLSHEEFWVLLLNNNARVIKRVRLSSGGLTQTAVDIRMILKEALIVEATNLVVCHNHPSGYIYPSKEDENITKKIMSASETMNIRLIDHVIVTDGQYYSFADNGKI